MSRNALEVHMAVPKVTLRLVFLLFAAALVPLTVSANCSESKVYRLYKNGTLIEKIADQCDIDVDEVLEIVDKKKARNGKKSSSPSTVPSPRPQRQAFCCDAFGNSRCTIVAGSTQVGVQCFCPGQGYGVICR